MAKKSALFGGRTVKVENRSAFDKSFLNMLTAPVGTLVPIVRQLLIPSSGRSKIPVHVELPPLATDAYIRSHLKMEAFFCPLRICYGGFQSWFSGDVVYDDEHRVFTRGLLPYGFIPRSVTIPEDDTYRMVGESLKARFGASSLTDYFDVRFVNDDTHGVTVPDFNTLSLANAGLNGLRVNLFPYLCYHLIYDHFYRNKSVSRPGFAPLAFSRTGIHDSVDNASYLPYQVSSTNVPLCVILGSDLEDCDGNKISTLIDDTDLDDVSGDLLLNGYRLSQLRQRNFGDDYFTCAKPNAQSGNPVSVQVDADGRFTIASIRLQNALQEFAENQNYASPDFIQTNMARYGVRLSDAIAQKPVLLASADFPIYTKSVEMSSAAGYSSQSGISARNPWSNVGLVGSKAGVASGNGTFSFDFDVKEPGYLMVLASLVPEANYSTGISKEMTILTSGDQRSLPDLPVSLLEHIGDEPIFQYELNPMSQRSDDVFGYVQRYLWHKSGNVNQIHGNFRSGESLQAFSPQRNFDDEVQISQAFLEVPTTALDDVASVSSGISEYGYMLDCAVELFVSEPLSESALPALVNPASEHGKSIYLMNGGSKLA